MIRLFMAFLRAAGVPRQQLTCRVAIHESGDVDGASIFWSQVVGDDLAFARPSIKRHSPRTVRLNTGARYHGCLAVSVLDGACVYRRIAGTWEGMSAPFDDHRSPVV